MNKVKSFVSQFIAMLNSDDAAAKAEKAARQANSALKMQISALEAKTDELEDAIESASEKLTNSFVNNGELITDKARYVADLYARKNELTIAEKAMKDHKDKLDFLNSCLTMFN